MSSRSLLHLVVACLVALATAGCADRLDEVAQTEPGAAADGTNPFFSPDGAPPTSTDPASTAPLPRAGADRAVVTKITDGDTINARFTISGANEKVRLIGIDTPEVHGRGGLKECFGAEASSHLKQLLPIGTEVRLERDVEPRDRYQRLLAYVFRIDTGDHVNLRMAADGFADVLTISPNVAYSDEYVDAVAVARAAGLGLWGACGSADVKI